ncbi:hypothetical protein F1880_002219 [Penicillium rolfsii]|nr:hypothetical protein F1880_002219 [Penicillium rolfsii]
MCADFYFFFPPIKSKWKTFLKTFLGVGGTLTFACSNGRRASIRHSEPCIMGEHSPYYRGP